MRGMKRDEIRGVFEQFAQSQGFYGRLLRTIDEDMTEEEQEMFWEHLEEQNFTNVLDVILFIEC